MDVVIVRAVWPAVLALAKGQPSSVSPNTQVWRNELDGATGKESITYSARGGEGVGKQEVRRKRGCLIHAGKSLLGWAAPHFASDGIEIARCGAVELPMTQAGHMFWHPLGNLAPIEPPNIPRGSVIQARATSFGRGRPRAPGKTWTVVALDGTSSGNWAAAFCERVRGIRSMAAGKWWPVVAGSGKLVVVGRCSKSRLFASGKLRRSDVVAAIARVTQPAQIQSCFLPSPASLPHKPV